VDWNKDGKMDLVVVNSGADAAHSVSILIGNGDGTFQPHEDIPGATNANSIAVGDFNHDGNPDIATSSNTPANTVHVSLGDGKGGVLAQKITSGFGQKSQPGEHQYLVSQIVWADFNRDGKDDLYYIQCCGGFDVEIGAWGVLVGNGDGTFTDHLVQALSVPRRILAVDINQDGLSDALIPYSGCHTPCEGLLAYINNGDGTFTGAVNSAINGVLPGGAAFAVDGDGLKDVVMVGSDEFTGDPNKGGVFISQQNADGTFSRNPTFVQLSSAFASQPSVVAADFNHDGKLDLAFVTDTDIAVALNTTPVSSCRQRTTDHTVTLCHPSDGAVGPSPAHIVSHATSSTPVNATQIYLDFKLVFQISGGNLDTNLALEPGNHRLEVKSWSNGASFRNDFFLTAISSSGGNSSPCTDNISFTVNVCLPGQNANVNSPVHVVAAAKSTVAITAMQIYVDGKLLFNTPNTSAIDTDVPIAKGTHLLVVKAWDHNGKNFSTSRNISVQ
jgi:hypothetical protein